MTTVTTAPRLKGITLPDKPMTKCARCLGPRGSKTNGWTPVIWQGQTVGWTCPECPRPNEPIRRIVTAQGVVRYRFTVTVTLPGSTKAIQKTGTADTLEEARAAVAAIRAEIRATGTYAKPARLSVEMLAERWLAAKEKDVKAGNLRAVTLNGSYRSALVTCCVHIGHREAEAVTIGEVRDLLNTLKTKGGKTGRPLGKASLTKALLSLRLIFEWGIEQRWLTTNPAAAVRVPKEAAKVDTAPRSPDDAEAVAVKSKGEDTWTIEQYGTFHAHVEEAYSSGTVAASREPWVRPGMRLTLCGLRRSEVLGLDWRNVDLSAGTVTVAASRVKTGRGADTETGGPKSKESGRIVRVEDVLPGTKAALRELWVAQGQPSSGLVILDNLAHPVQPDAYSRRFVALCDGAGVPRLRAVHRLRHTIATALHRAGVAPVEAASLLGHSVGTHLAFYVPNSNEHGAAAATKAGAIFARRAAAAE